MTIFQEWKMSILLKEYSNGSIGFKQFCKLSGMTIPEGILFFEKVHIEPPISEIIDNYTDKIRESLKISDLTKNGKIPVRESPIMEFDDE